MMSANNNVLIKMEGVKKVFLTDEVETHALEEIHLEIHQGQYVSISGPSGCGKSTLLSILGLLDSPSEGNYLLNGQPVANLTSSERTRIRNREIGFIFQAFNLIGDLTVYDISTRIGAFLKLEPNRIYLHAGTRIGARALLPVTGRAWIIRGPPAAVKKNP